LIAGQDRAEAAWFIVQHAIGEPDFQREMLDCCTRARLPNAYGFGTPRIWKIAWRCFPIPARSYRRKRGETFRRANSAGCAGWLIKDGGVP
jgi:hypothetical protein